MRHAMLHTDCHFKMKMYIAIALALAVAALAQETFDSEAAKTVILDDIHDFDAKLFRLRISVDKMVRPITALARRLADDENALIEIRTNLTAAIAEARSTNDAVLEPLKNIRLAYNSIIRGYRGILGKTEIQEPNLSGWFDTLREDREHLEAAGARLSAIDTNPTPDVDWTQCWEEVTVDNIPADCYTTVEGDAIIYDTRDIPTIYDRFDARSHCGARSESRYMYTKPVHSSIDNWRLVASCINDNGICLQTEFSDNYGQFFLKIDSTVEGGVRNIPASEMAFDEDCTGDGLISDWIWDPVAYNLEECSDAGGTYVYGRLATLEASCYPNIECTLPAQDQTVYRKKAECIFD